jgi:hypothetical protein
MIEEVDACSECRAANQGLRISAPHGPYFPVMTGVWRCLAVSATEGPGPRP